MKGIRKLNIKNILLFYIAIGAFINNNIYWGWETYHGGIWNPIIKFIRYSGLIILFIIAIQQKEKPIKTQKQFIVIFFELLMVSAVACYAGSEKTVPYNMGYIISAILLIVSFFLHQEDQAKIFDYIVKIFVVISFPSLVYYIITVILGIEIPYEYLIPPHQGKAASGLYYELRPMGLIIKNQYQTILPRYCGVFDEPGMIGTLSAIFLSATLKRKENKVWSILLVLEGILSFSMAFYILILINIIFISMMKGIIQVSVTICLVAVGIILFLNIDFQNPQLKNIQNRIDISSRFFVKDNRTNSEFEKEYRKMMDNAGYELLFGHGIGYVQTRPELSASFSYKLLIFEHGLIGAFLYIGFFVLLAVFYYKLSKDNLNFLLLFFASIYQRPYIMSQQYTMIFIFALSWINVYGKNRSIR